MSDRPTYEELELRISKLENQLEQYSETPDLLHDTRLFGELFQKDPDLIVVAESDQAGQPGKILLANPTALIQLEYTLKEIQALTLQSLLGESDSGVKKDSLYPGALKYEKTFFTKSGRKIHANVYTHIILHGQEKYAFAIIHDISERKAMEESLRHSEEKYRLLINNLGEGIGMVDPDDVFLFANPKAEEIFGVAKGKLEGKSLFDFVDNKGRDLILEQTERRKSGEKNRYEMEIRQAGGKKRQILVTATPQYHEDLFKGTFAVFRDVTDWRTTEKSLRKSESELREANAAKDKFFSIIAHDLKNPFNSIQSLSELLLKDYAGYDKEEVLTLIKMINDASRQTHNLLDNLLNWSRAQTGRMSIEPTGINIHDSVESIFTLYEGNSREKNLLMLNKVKAGTLAYGDANMVPTILRNLISNAIKFTKPRGKITVSAKIHRDFIDISVNDTGIGIPEDIHKKLFRIEENVTRTGTANEEGTGLGLVLCKEFAEKNDGSIKVNSKPGKWSTFILRLPRPGN